MRRESDEITRWHGSRGPVVLADGPDGLELRTPGERAGTGVRSAVEDLLGRPSDRRHPLARIVAGVQARSDSPIIDATAGLGGDAVIAAVAAPERSVLACERHPLVAAVLEDGLRRARSVSHPAAARILVRFADAVSVLQWQGRLDPDSGVRLRPRPAIVVLDPMFPTRRRSSALPPKPMQRLRELAETPDPDRADRETRDLLAAADAAGAMRIVLKRPPEASTPVDPLGPPTFTIETRLVHWLVWERSASGTTTS